jgi:uncharacterized cupin superfamily protein
VHPGAVLLEAGDPRGRAHRLRPDDRHPDGGQPQDIGPGDSAVFPRGWTGAWQIHETIRKLYVLF